MAPGFDPYAVLGVSRDATAAQITQARRRLSRQYHPDVNSAPDAAARFDAVQRAFTLLSDPAARAVYDRARNQPGKPRQAGAATGSVRGIVAQPAAVNFGHLGPSRPVADATVTVTWTGARPGRIIGDQGSDWWMIVGTAASSSSNAVLFHLRAWASAGLPDGPRHAQFTARLDGTQVAVPLTAEFSRAARSPAPSTAKPTPPAPWWPRLLVLGLFVTALAVKVIFLGIGNPADSTSAGDGGQATGSPPAQSEQAASPPVSASVPQAREGAIDVRPVFTASQAAADKATERSEGLAGAPVQHGFEVLLPVASPSGAGTATTDFCVTVTVPRSHGATGSSFTESALGTVTAGGGTDLAFPVALPGRYTLDPHCSPSGAAPMTLGTVTTANLGVLNGTAGADAGSAMVVFGIHTSGTTTSVTYGAIGRANSAELSRTPPADGTCVDRGAATGPPSYRQPVQSLVSQQAAGPDEWLQTGTLVFHGVIANDRPGSYFHYDCAADVVDGAPGIAVP